MAEGKLVRIPPECYETVKAKAQEDAREIGQTVARLVTLGLASETSQRADAQRS